MGAATWGEEGQLSPGSKSVLREGAGGSGKPSISCSLLTIALAEAGHLLVMLFSALWRITEVRGVQIGFLGFALPHFPSLYPPTSTFLLRNLPLSRGWGCFHGRRSHHMEILV